MNLTPLSSLPAEESVVVPVQLNNMWAGAHQLVATVFDYFQELQPGDNDDVFNYDVNGLPVMTILSPSNGQDYVSTDKITFSATTNDPEDGDLSTQVSWSSSVDGPIAKGNEITALLSAGNHIITATAVDNTGASASKQVSVFVEEYNSAPSATIISPTNGSTFNEDDGIVSY
jgi:hypothetical protein